VTVCVKDRREWFGEIKDGAMILNEYGQIVKKRWFWLPEQYPYVELDEFVVMPNHFHGILLIIGNGRERSLQMTGAG
jgi:REP element-mobilizing transposase RayT